MKSLLMTIGLLSATAVGAVDLNAEMDALCEKSQRCMIEYMKETLPPSMLGAIEHMEDVSCDMHQQAIDITDAKGPEMSEAAAECLQAMNALSCTELRTGTLAPACEKFQSIQ